MSFVALDFLNGIAIFLFLHAMIWGNHEVALGVVAVYGAIIALAKFFGVFPEGYRDHLLKPARPPK